MGIAKRGTVNAFRGNVRSIATVAILAITVGLELLMLLSRSTTPMVGSSSTTNNRASARAEASRSDPSVSTMRRDCDRRAWQRPERRL